MPDYKIIYERTVIWHKFIEQWPREKEREREKFGPMAEKRLILRKELCHIVLLIFK